MEYTNSKYEGAAAFGRFNGWGVLEMADGSRYEGEFRDGQFHGHGTLHFKEGKMEGSWDNGRQVEGTFTFSDGLHYAPEDWKYCVGADRRFHAECVSEGGILPAGELSYFDSGTQRNIPIGSYDAGNGVFTPSSQLVSSYDDPHDTRQVSEEEQQWIIDKAPKAMTSGSG